MVSRPQPIRKSMEPRSKIFAPTLHKDGKCPKEGNLGVGERHVNVLDVGSTLD